MYVIGHYNYYYNLIPYIENTIFAKDYSLLIKQKDVYKIMFIYYNFYNNTIIVYLYNTFRRFVVWAVEKNSLQILMAIGLKKC